MDGDGARGGLEMARGSLARIEDGRGMRLYVREGELWITQEGDRRDYYVGAGGRVANRGQSPISLLYAA